MIMAENKFQERTKQTKIRLKRGKKKYPGPK